MTAASSRMLTMFCLPSHSSEALIMQFYVKDA